MTDCVGVDMEHPSQPLAYMPGETPILMADWLLKPLAEVRAGDEVVGWKSGTTADRAHLVRTVVAEIHEASTDLIEVQTVSGNPVRCAPDALWFTNRSPSVAEPHRKQYAEVRAGSWLMQMDLIERQPTARESRLWYYLAGMVDGEGHINDSSLPITQTTGKNLPVWERLCEVLNELGIGFNKKMAERTRADWEAKGDAVIRNVRDVYRQLLRYSEPAKADQIREALWRRPSRPVRSRDRIARLEPLGKTSGFALVTDSGNHVAWGYAASNFAQSNCCSQGHLMNVRTDAAGKTYRTCPTCPGNTMSATVDAARRVKIAARQASQCGPDDLLLLAQTADLLRSGEARAIRERAGVTQVELSGRCRVSQGMISGWEMGQLELKGMSGLRYAQALSSLHLPT